MNKYFMPRNNHPSADLLLSMPGPLPLDMGMGAILDATRGDGRTDVRNAGKAEGQIEFGTGAYSAAPN
jgi:hypothetical protein